MHALPALQQKGKELLASSKGRGHVQLAAPVKPSSAKKTPASVVPVQSRQFQASAVLKALGDLSAHGAASASSTTRALATPAPAEEAASTVPAENGDADQASVASDAENVEDDFASFEIPNEVEEDMGSAYEVWLSFVELTLELHHAWDDHDLEERIRRGERAEELGKRWAVAVRKHSKFTCNHYYCHVAFAHLKELIISNGHLFSGDDAILERGHRQYKRLRAITSAGGKVASQQNPCPKMTMMRQQKGDTGELQLHAVQAPCRSTQAVQVATLARVLMKRQAMRKRPRISARAVATEIRKRAERHDVKQEAALALKNEASECLPAL